MGSLKFDITGDNSNLMNALDEVERGVKKTSKSVEESGMDIDAMFGKITKAAAGLGVAFSAQQFASQVMKVRGEFQQLEVAFNTMLDSEERAAELMSQLTRTAAVTPFGLQDVAGGAKQLLAYGIASEKVNETLVRLGDIAAGLSIPLNDLVYLYGTTMTQGKMFTQDLRQFQGRGVPLADELAKQFGVTKDKVGELVTAGSVGFEHLEKAIVSMTSEGSKFGGLMEAQSKTITGQISNIEDSIDMMFNTIGQSSEGVINMALGGVSAVVENWEKVGEAIGVVVTAYGAYKAALITAMAFQKAEAAVTAEAAVQKSLAALAGHTLSTAQARATATSILFANAQALVAKSLKAVAAATILNPYVLAAAAITAVTYGIYKLATADSEAVKEQERLNKALEEHQKQLEENKKEVDELVSSLGNLEISEGERISNFTKLKQMYPEILKNINNENEFLKEKHNILKQINQEQDKESQSALKLQLAREKELQTLYEKAIELGNVSIFTKNKYEEKLKGISSNIQTLQGQIAQFEVDNFLENIGEIDTSSLSIMLTNVNRQVELLEKSGDNAIGRVAGISKDVSEFTKAQLKTIQGALQSEQKNRGAEKKTASQWLAKYKKDYEASEKELKDFKKQKDKLTEAQYEKDLKTLQDKRDAAKKKYEAAGGSVKADDKSDKERLKNEKKAGEELLAIQRENQQAEIDLWKEGSEKRLRQLELDYQKELDAIKKQKEEWEEAQKGKLTKEQQKALSERAGNAFMVKVSGIAEVTRQERQDWNEYLKEFGSYQEKRQAIIDLYQEKINSAGTEGKRMTLKEQMTKELADLDTEIQGKTNLITQLFDDMTEKTVADMRKIASTAEKALSYLNTGVWVEDETNKGFDKFGFTKEQFEILSKSPEKLKAIKDEIYNLNQEADESETTLKKMTNAFRELFGGDFNTKNFDDKLDDILDGVSKITQAFEFLGDSLAALSEAFGGNFLGGLAEGIGVATDAANSALSGAQAGAVFGPWGAAAGAAIGLVSSLTSSLSKLHDKKHERNIQRIQEQIEVLEKSYDTLSKSISKAYSNDAADLIDEQNVLLEQQKVLIQSQIKEEEAKKNTDNNRINEWREQLDQIDQTIAENKEAAIDAIFGEDLKSAIDNFASAYVEAWGAGEDKAKSAKDMVKQMIKNMITESIKAAASDPMKKIREKLLEFWSDEYISGWEQDYLNKMATDLQKELDNQFGWADGIMGGDSTTSQEASGKGFQTMSQETGEELNGRFTALQLAGEEIKNQMIQAVVLYTQMLGLTSQSNGILSDILIQQAIANGYLSDIAKYSKIMSAYGEKIDKIVENTQNL